MIDPGFTTERMRAVFDAAARVAAMCRFEGALAAASADAGVVPAGAAEQIARACAAPSPDPMAILAAGWAEGTPVLPLLRELRAALPDDAAHWLHHGATTQDVVDSGLAVQARDGLAALDGELCAVAGTLRQVVEEHRDLPVQGWTFLQPAEPTTVGLRAAGWLAPTVRHLGALRAARAGLVVQLGGPTGTQAALGDRADAVTEGLARRLGLAVPDLPWHTDRSRVAELAGLLERVARTMAKIGTDLVLLAHDGEVRVRAGASSSMPGKRNPIDAVRAIAAAEACSGAASIVTRGRPPELERGAGGWHAEWLAVPLTFCTCAAAVEGIRRALTSLEIDAAPAAAGPSPAAQAFVDRVLRAHDRLRRS